MKLIGSFQSEFWGRVDVKRAAYGGAGGPTAIVLTLKDGALLGKLSVNISCQECSHDSKYLPPDCFYVKTWSENETIASEALASGLFVQRDDLKKDESGFVSAPVWQIKTAWSNP